MSLRQLPAGHRAADVGDKGILQESVEDGGGGGDWMMRMEDEEVFGGEEAFTLGEGKGRKRERMSANVTKEVPGTRTRRDGARTGRLPVPDFPWILQEP